MKRARSGLWQRSAVVVEARLLVEPLAGVAVRDTRSVVVNAVVRVPIVRNHLARIGWLANAFRFRRGRASDLTGASVGLMRRGIEIERSLWYDE